MTAVTAFRALFQGCFFAFRILSENQHRPDRLPWPGVVWHPAVLSQIGMGERRYARWEHRRWFREEKRPVPIKNPLKIFHSGWRKCGRPFREGPCCNASSKNRGNCVRYWMTVLLYNSWKHHSKGSEAGRRRGSGGRQRYCAASCRFLPGRGHRASSTLQRCKVACGGHRIG